MSVRVKRTLTPATGFVVETTSGTGSGQTRVITAYNTTSKVASVYPNWTTPPDATTPAPVDTTTDTTLGTQPDTPERTTRKMPATASPLPLIGLVGLASLAAGAALRRFGSR